MEISAYMNYLHNQSWQSTSDDSRREIDSGLYTSYDFSDVSIPAGAEIASVIVYVEHFEQEGFPDGKLQWNAGTGWPSNPVVWASMNAPVHEGELNEATDLWDVTSFVDTPEKVNSLQLQVKNNDNIAKRKTLVDYIYVVVEWYWRGQLLKWCGDISEKLFW